MLRKQPDDFDVRLGAAVALTQVMAIRTNGNLPLVDALQDTDANRALWADLGGRALEHARAAAKLRPQSPEAAAALASSYMFYASSLGIIRSIVSGAGGEYRQHAQRLIDLDPKFDDGLGTSLLANLYLVAPWPVHDRDAALEHFERAAAARARVGAQPVRARRVLGARRRRRARAHALRARGRRSRAPPTPSACSVTS